MRNALYLLSMLYHLYNIVIDCCDGAPEYGKYIIDGFNTTDKRFLSMLITTSQLPSASNNKSYMVMHTAISNTDISLERVFQEHLSYPTCALGFIDHG